MRISAKDLGAITLPLFCPRCFWITRHAARLPFQIFPGIFSSIDSYSKKITWEYHGVHKALVRWLADLGLAGYPVKVPHHTKFKILDPETGVLLTGMPDEILHLPDDSYAILDYKTAKFTGHQDALMPMYEVQLNAYAYIGERLEFNPVSGLFLVYYEPVTDIAAEEIDSLVRDNGFQMHFSGKPLAISKKTDEIPALLRKALAIYELAKPPDGRADCADCQALDDILGMLSP
jgi:hypothetical protein